MTSDRAPVLHRNGLIGLAAFTALSGLGGGAALLAVPHGNASIPLFLLDGTPFDSFLVPGLLLVFVVGGSSLLAAIALLRRWSLSLDTSLLAGGVLTFWIADEVALMRTVHWLHVLYGVVGLLLLLSAVRSAMRQAQHDARLRLRWTIGVTLAETIGFLCPLSIGMALHGRVADGTFAILVTLAGFFEGLFLGAGQAWVMPLPIARARYALLTGLGACFVWGLAMLGIQHGEEIDRWPALVQVPLVVLASTVGLCAIGSAQWLELRKHTARAHVFIGFTALAWLLALPMSFLPSPLVDERTPLAIHFVLWGSAGCLMAYVMALVTYRGVVRMLPAHAK